MMGQDVFRRLGGGGEQVAVLLAAGMFYFSPWLLLTLVAGALVAAIVFLRPSLGLMLTMFVAPLYMHPLSLLGKSFSMAELVLLPTLAGSFVQIVGAWRAGQRVRFGVAAYRAVVGLRCCGAGFDVTGIATARGFP